MQPFFIIDRSHHMYLQQGNDTSDAMARHNDIYKIPADLAIQAQPCPHKRYIIPELPEWMEYTPNASCKLCLKCSTPQEPENGFIDNPKFFTDHNNIIA